jgi:peptidoglycan hydrolase-like protein with peptidoglycan-binding domain
VQGIVQDKSVNGEYRITFAVDETYKGTLGDTVTVRTRSSSAACGYDDGYASFDKGSVWAIYAVGNDKTGYSTDSLSLNTEYDSVPAATKALTELGLTAEDDSGPVMCTMQYAPVCGRSVDGTVKTFGNSCTLGAEKAVFLYNGECKVPSIPPAQDLKSGMQGAGVTWLQAFLIEKATGVAASALATAGSTGYFGTFTTAALAEFQSAHSIMPAAGYFGAKTRAAIAAMLAPQDAATFVGEISAVDTGCFSDGICSVTIDGKEVILLAGLRVAPIPPVGTLKGVDSIGDLEDKIGSKAEVYAATTKEGGADYTLYGDTSYYVKVLD